MACAIHMTLNAETKGVGRFIPSIFVPTTFRLVEIPTTIGIDMKITHLHIYEGEWSWYFNFKTKSIYFMYRKSMRHDLSKEWILWALSSALHTFKQNQQ